MAAPGQTAVSLVGADELEHYPISSEDRLDSHYFYQWNLKRWRASEWRKEVDPEAGWYGIQLFFLSQDGCPVGTLPCADHLLAYDLNLPLERWHALLRRDVSPLKGWYKVICDNGEVRLAHKVVTEVAREALKSKKRNSAAAEQRKLNKRLADLREMIGRIGASQLLKQAGFVERFNDWLDEHHEGMQRRETMIRPALDAFMAELSA
ncbi:MAG: hypothetical protein ACSHX3_15820 [Litorimonas sp.]